VSITGVVDLLQGRSRLPFHSERDMRFLLSRLGPPGERKEDKARTFFWYQQLIGMIDLEPPPWWYVLLGMVEEGRQ